MNTVKIWFCSSVEPLELKMGDEELTNFLGFMQPQQVTNVFEHEEYGWDYRINKENISLFGYKRLGE